MKNNVVIRDNKSNLFISSSFFESKVAGIFNLYKTYKTVSGLFVIVLCKKKMSDLLWPPLQVGHSP